eukprot:COSAG01_NODE_57761_length_310_cov_0.786730_1_plen_61_part_01
MTAYHIACESGHLELMEYLLEAKCDTSLRTVRRKTGWDLAELACSHTIVSEATGETQHLQQ